MAIRGVDALPAVQFGYQAIGRLASIQYGSQAPFTLAYDAFGRPSTLVRPNGVTDSFSYSSSGDLTGRDASLNGSAVARFDYGIDPVTGQRTSLTDNAGTHSFTYYDNGWLKSVTHPAGSGLANESYTYDSAGNRSSAGIPSVYDPADRLLSDGTFTWLGEAPRRLATILRRPWGYCVPDHTVTLPSGRTSATAQLGPSIAWFSNGVW